VYSYTMIALVLPVWYYVWSGITCC